MKHKTLDTVPVKKVNLADEVATQLKNLILEGKLKPGDRLPSESAMAEMFSVGRTSVREALKAMDAVGLIERTKKGTIVRNQLAEPYKELFQLIIKKHGIEQLYEARMIFEIMIVRLAASRATDEDIEEMKRHIDLMNTEDFDQYIEADLAFHMAIAEAAQNAILLDAYQVVKSAFAENVGDLILHYPDIMKISGDQHNLIFSAIEKQDEDRAEALIKEHLEFLLKEYKKKVVGTLE